MACRTCIIIGVVAVVAGAGIAGWQINAQPTQPAAAPAVPAVPVVATKVQVSDMPIVKTGLGTVVAYNTVAVHAQVTGTIEKVGFIEGQEVHPGSLIVQLDPRPYQAMLQQAEANLARDQAHLTNAQANLARYVPLQKNGFATEQQVSDQTASVAEQQAAVVADKAAIDNAQTQLSYTTITSPIDGVTGILGVDIGNIVQPTDTKPIVTITQIQPISVVFTLPQNDVPAVLAAMAKGPLQAIAYSQDASKELATGTLLLVNNMISPTSGTVDLKATFPNQGRMLWPGEYVTVRLVLEVRHNALSVPLTALQQGQNGSLVFVVGPDDTVQTRAVSVAETLNGRALIDQGLQAGDTVVTAGQYRLNEGTKVVLVAPNDPHLQTSTPATQGMLQ
ncbi:MAG: efflux RND transporter periplasmic adaptor subunit [Acetobacteraceae bacterium]